MTIKNQNLNLFRMSEKSTTNKIICMIKAGYSINYISKHLATAKSTIYYHYKKINGRKYNIVKIPDNQMILGEISGVFAGDGSFFFNPKY